MTVSSTLRTPLVSSPSSSLNVDTPSSEELDDFGGEGQDEPENHLMNFVVGGVGLLFEGGVAAKELFTDGLYLGANRISDAVRSSDAQFLTSLTGEEVLQEAISSVMPDACYLIDLLFPEYFESITRTLRKDSVKKIIGNLVLHVLANFGREIFSEKLAEKISLEKFFQEIGFFLFRIIQKDLIAIDEEVKTSKNLPLKKFESLATKILDIALPKDQESRFSQLFVKTEKSMAKRLALEPLTACLVLTYKQWILKEKQDSPSRLKEIEKEEFEKLKPLIEKTKQAINFLTKAFCNHVLQEENRYFESLTLSKELAPMLLDALSPLVKQIALALPPQYGDFIVEDPEGLQKLIAALLIKIVANITREFCEKENVKYLSEEDLVCKIVLYTFSTVHENYLGVTEKSTLKKKIKPEYFLPFVKRGIELILPESRWILEIVERRFPEVMISICHVMYDFDSVFQLPSKKNSKQRLRERLWNVEELNVECRDMLSKLGGTIPEKPDKQSSRILGKEEIIDRIYFCCKRIAKQTIEMSRVSLENIDELITTINHAYPNFVQNPLKDHVLRGLKKAFISKDPGFEKMLSFFQKGIARYLFQSFVTYLEQVHPEKKLSSTALLSSALVKFIQVFASHLPNIKEKNSVSAVNFQPLSSAIWKLFLQKNSFASTSWLKQIAELLNKEVLPFFLFKSYKETLIWDDPLENRERLHKVFGNNRAAEACRILGHYIQELSKNYCRVRSKDLAELLVESTGEYFLKMPSKPEKLNELRRIFTCVLKGLGRSETPLCPFIGTYAENALLHVFADFAEMIVAVENNYAENKPHEGSLNVRLMLMSFQNLAKHFSEINKVKNKLGEKHASRVALEAMVAAFERSGQLHRAMNPKKPKNKELFFVEQSKKIVSLFGVNSDQPLPLPSPLKTFGFDLFQEVLLPIALEAIVEKAMDSHTLHGGLLGFLKQVNQTMQNADQEAGKKLPENFFSLQIEQVCGNLLEELLGLQPSLIARKLMKYRSVRDKAGAALASNTTKMFEKSFIQLIEDFIYQFLPLVLKHGGRWESKKGTNGPKDCLVTLKKQGTKLVPGWDFGFPETKKERKDQKIELNKKREKTLVELQRELTGMITKQAKLTWKAALAGIWVDLQVQFDKEITANFDQYGLEVKHVLDKVCRFMHDYFFKFIGMLFIYPLHSLSWALLHFYFKHQAKLRIEDIESKIHVDLIFKELEGSIDLLRTRKQVLVRGSL